jgi:hypothetical protein
MLVVYRNTLVAALARFAILVHATAVSFTPLINLLPWCHQQMREQRAALATLKEQLQSDKLRLVVEGR